MTNFQRQVYSQLARTPEEANRRNAPPAVRSGHIWAGSEQVGWIKDGDVFSVATEQKFATLDEGENLYSVEGKPLDMHLETVNGGGRIGPGAHPDALPRFKSSAGIK